MKTRTLTLIRRVGPGWVRRNSMLVPPCARSYSASRMCILQGLVWFKRKRLAEMALTLVRTEGHSMPVQSVAYQSYPLPKVIEWDDWAHQTCSPSSSCFRELGRSKSSVLMRLVSPRSRKDWRRKSTNIRILVEEYRYWACRATTGRQIGRCG